MTENFYEKMITEAMTALRADVDTIKKKRGTTFSLPMPRHI